MITDARGFFAGASGFYYTHNSLGCQPKAIEKQKSLWYTDSIITEMG